MSADRWRAINQQLVDQGHVMPSYWPTNGTLIVDDVINAEQQRQDRRDSAGEQE